MYGPNPNPADKKNGRIKASKQEIKAALTTPTKIAAVINTASMEYITEEISKFYDVIGKLENNTNLAKYGETVKVTKKIMKNPDRAYFIPVCLTTRAIDGALNSKSDLQAAVKGLGSLITSGADAKKRKSIKSDLLPRLGKFTDSGSILTAGLNSSLGTSRGGSISEFAKANPNFFKGNTGDVYKAIQQLSNGAVNDTEESKNGFEFIKYVYDLAKSGTGYKLNGTADALDEMHKNSEEILNTVKDMQSRISNLSSSSEGTDMNDSTIEDFNAMSSKLQAYQTSMSEILTRVIPYVMALAKAHLAAVADAYDAYLMDVLVRA